MPTVLKLPKRPTNQALGQTSQGLHYRDKYTWIRLYCQFCRPHLDYCAQVYSPWNKSDIDLLEAVQERAVKMVSGLRGKTYEERLKEVGLTTLKERRTRGDLIQVWKTLHMKDDVKPDTWFTFVRKPSNGTLTRHTSDQWNLVKPNTTKSLAIRTNFWSVRCVDNWNNLPSAIKSASTLDSFKEQYDSFLNLV